ncbi:hypothetical protein EV192_106804 [Actinocrispum wychmicini]|uniref:Uncharacterized protein n=1 Tax=Actinocrispum wychmicini TaxID=1213861 RepID=A0A4R2JFG0_9PSEU|nr:hypothetical protein EV192_106804 [Actinocrispum wychmicini]
MTAFLSWYLPAILGALAALALLTLYLLLVLVRKRLRVRPGHRRPRSAKSGPTTAEIRRLRHER